ncbi:MAG TPA: CoA transferase subunit A [Actinomycetales bacterium]|nr:CoA transferase subunit A [Actinomycetales bacterium]
MTETVTGTAPAAPTETAKTRETDGRALVASLAKDGMTIAVGGFGLCGVPYDLIEGLRDSGAKNLTIVSNNMGVDGQGLGILLENHQVSKVVASYVGENKLFAKQYLDGELEVEFNPQGTLAERLRAGGAGIPAFYTATGVGTLIAEGKPHAEFDGKTYVQERGIVADLALVHAWRGDVDGNLIYRGTARNFNPLCAASGRITVAEVEELTPLGSMDPASVMTPGVYIDHVVTADPREKPIEQRTTRPRPDASGTAAEAGEEK